MTVIESYLGWELLAHRTDCQRQQWAVDLKTDTFGLRRLHEGGEKHGCPNEDCGHANRFEETTVRIVCSSCGIAHTIKGELTGRGLGPVEHIGYGLPPRKVVGLFLYPGEPFLSYGRLASSEPFDFVVTREQVDRVNEEHVFGLISQARGKRGAVQWSALAVPDPDGQYGYGRPVRFARGQEAFKTVTAAAKWIAAQLKPQPNTTEDP